MVPTREARNSKARIGASRPIVTPTTIYTKLYKLLARVARQKLCALRTHYNNNIEMVRVARQFCAQSAQYSIRMGLRSESRPANYGVAHPLLVHLRLLTSIRVQS